MSLTLHSLGPTLPAPDREVPCCDAMPLDPLENLQGNVAVRVVNDRGGLVARVLKADESHDTFTELRAMPHFATCKPPADPELPIEPTNVVDFVAARRARGARQ